MHKLMKLIKRILTVVLLLFVFLGGLLFWMRDPWYLSAPNDQELMKKFSSGKPEYDSVRMMMAADALAYLSLGDQNKNLSDARQVEYARLLKLLDKPTVRSDGNVTKFIYASGGLFSIGPGWQKGILYGADGCGVKVTSLDNPEILDPNYPYCKEIEGNWFLVFEKYE